MKRTNLSEVERERALEEGIDPSLVEETKVKWVSALEIISQVLSLDCSNIEVVYEPKRVFAVGIDWYNSQSNLLIGTPRRETPFDYYPDLEAKIGGVAHEIGHLADYDQYPDAQYVKSSFGGCSLRESGISFEQRASLYAFALAPTEFQALVKTRIQSNRKRKSGVEILWRYDGEYEAIETLGEIGMPRTFNVARFLKELFNQASSSDEYVESSMKSSLYGLAKSPDSDLVMLDKSYDEEELDRVFSEYMKGKISEEEFNARRRELRSVQYIEGYNPAKSIDYRWIIRDPAISRLQEERKKWQRISCTPEVRNDMITALDYCIRELEI